MQCYLLRDANRANQCPQSLEITISLFQEHPFQYVPWEKYLDLHYKSLKIPPATVFNKTILKSLDRLYKTLDKKLSVQIEAAGENIDNIEELKLGLSPGEYIF